MPSTADSAATARVIACFTALHRPNEALSFSVNAGAYTCNGKAIVANLRDIAWLIKKAALVLH